MLLTVREDNTTGSFYLCHCLHMINTVIKSGALYILMGVYKQFLYVQMAWSYICGLIRYWSCIGDVRLAIHVLTVVCIYILILQNYG